MPLRIHELHPSIAHYPLVLFPASIVADVSGRMFSNPFLTKLGGVLMPLAAAMGAVTAAAGLVAQDAVETPGEAHDMLVTHRNLNAGLVIASAVLAVIRGRTERPSAAYLATGAAAVVAMHYTAYLGGSMVYRHGVGVEAADGIHRDRTPEIASSRLGHTVSVAGRNALGALKHAAKHLREGQIAPALAKAVNHSEQH